MKYAIGLFGIHYQKNLKHWMPDWVFDVNYKNVIENNKEYLYRNNDITFYSSTYFSDKLPDLIEDFKFKKLQLTHFVNEKEKHISDRWVKRNERFRETIELILKDNITYDYVIIQRFDIVWKHSIFDYKLDLNKINLICRSKTFTEDALNDDNFYFIPYNLLENFYKELCNIPKDFYSHYQFMHIKNFHYLIDEAYGNHEIPVYVINRVPSKKII